MKTFENMIVSTELGSLQQSVNQLISTKKHIFCSLPLSQSLLCLNASKAPIPEKPGRLTYFDMVNEASARTKNLVSNQERNNEGCLAHVQL